ncbi:MAG: hypothetical protein SP4CHLAM5_00900 [Chlamydiia bacterium]|nr:hypothetical protein [Chlamydiia bacterium]MCH9617967.1 hypothetical protein [Chlamydiia bacterium]MCH9623708.1 hypothetical protein [Chlamydiia bacterium]
MNPKRLKREVKREMQKIKDTSKPSTHAQDYMREELVQKKLERKSFTKKMKDTRKKEQFDLKQAKRKEKHRGH